MIELRICKIASHTYVLSQYDYEIGKAGELVRGSSVMFKVTELIIGEMMTVPEGFAPPHDTIFKGYFSDPIEKNIMLSYHRYPHIV